MDQQGLCVYERRVEWAESEVDLEQNSWEAREVKRRACILFPLTPFFSSLSAQPPHLLHDVCAAQY